MASGMELMMQSMFRAMGFNPQQFVKQIDEFFLYVQTEMVKFSTTAQAIKEQQDRIEREQANIDAKLELILAYHESKVIHHERTNEHANSHRTNGSGISATDDVTE